MRCVPREENEFSVKKSLNVQCLVEEEFNSIPVAESSLQRVGVDGRCHHIKVVVHTCGISRTGLPDSERIRRSSLVLVSLGTYLTSIDRTLLQFPLYLLFFMLLYFPVFLYLLLYSVSSCPGKRA